MTLKYLSCAAQRRLLEIARQPKPAPQRRPIVYDGHFVFINGKWVPWHRVGSFDPAVVRERLKD